VEAGFPLASTPVVEPALGQLAMIVGQAPGSVEGLEGRPWRGRAGRTLRRWLEMDEPTFYTTFYCCSVTRCDPGRDPGGRGDRAPTPAEIALCRPWLDADLRLLRPKLVLCVGGLATRQVLGIRRLTEQVGERLPLADAVAIPLPHPSGASGWLNAPENRKRLAAALTAVREELGALGALPGAAGYTT
jgi:uracil-DNA glycosylase